MTTPRGVEAKLKRLKALAKELVTSAVVDELRRLLRDASNFVVADAAEIAGDKLIADLAPDLAAAFDRFMIDPLETDKGCRAKFAALTALHKLEYDKPDIFLRGIKHVQKEWRWGQPEPEDTAADLRGQCAFALVRLGYRDILVLLADLLADKEKQARSAAAQALAATGNLAAIPLLRFKLHFRDEEPDVMQDCFAALITLDPAESIPLVARYLEGRDGATQEAAALALGESRHPTAFAPLRKFCDQTSNPEVAFLALSLSRLPPAIDYLLEIVSVRPARRDSPDPAAPATEGLPNTPATNRAVAALSALAIHRHNPTTRERVADAVAKNGDPAVRNWFDKKFRVGD